MEEIEVVLDTDLPAEFVNVGPCQFDASRSTTHSQVKNVDNHPATPIDGDLTSWSSCFQAVVHPLPIPVLICVFNKFHGTI